MKCSACGDDTIETKFYLYGKGVAVLCDACADEKKLGETEILSMPDGYVVVGYGYYDRIKTEHDNVIEVAEEWETLLKYSFHAKTSLRIDALFKHLLREKSSEAQKFETLIRHVVDHLLGERILINMVLNGDWTHAMKNQTIKALGELVETGIRNLREKQKREWATLDVFQPDWSLAGQYRKRIQAEEQIESMRDEIYELREKLAEAKGEKADVIDSE